MYNYTSSYLSSQAGVDHIILAVSYRAEMLEKELREQEEKVSCNNYNNDQKKCDQDGTFF